MKRAACVLLIVLLAFLLCGCVDPQKYNSYESAIEDAKTYSSNVADALTCYGHNGNAEDSLLTLRAYIDYEEKITKKELLDALDALDECIEYISRNTENMKSILRGL